MASKHTVQVAESYSVRPVEGELFEVVDLSGRIVSAHPMAWRAAVALAQHLDSDSSADAMRRDKMAKIKTAQELASRIAAPARIFFEASEEDGKTYSTAMSAKNAVRVVAALQVSGISAVVCEPTVVGARFGGLVSVELV